ncbi:MAG: hypothetical protein IJ055_02030 [Oscillospiraceae bacterium]|nr:hypothetical protein [Oscillospiraceae bacterium]
MHVKHILSALLCAVMTAGTLLPCYAHAVETPDPEGAAVLEDSAIAGDMDIRSENAFGKLFAQELTEKQHEQLQGSGCTVFSVTMDGNTANVEFQTRCDAALVVGIYDEDGTQLIASGCADVTADDREMAVTIDADLPEYYDIKAYLIDPLGLAPLSVEYENPNYTQEMQAFFRKTVDDFPAERVLNLDEDPGNNFAVYRDEVIVLDPQDGYDIVTAADADSGVYVIEHADETVLDLQPGDLLAYAYGEEDVLILKVGTLAVNGTAVTITGAPSSMEEIFSFVRIEAQQGMEDAVITPAQDVEVTERSVTETSVAAGEGTVLAGAPDSGVTLEKSLSHDFGGEEFKYEQKGSHTKLTVKVSGSVEAKFSISAKLYLDWSRTYLEFKIPYELTVSMGVSGELELEFPLGTILFEPLPCLNVELKPALVARFSGKLEIATGISGSFGFRADQNGISNISEIPKADAHFEAQGKIFLGVKLDPVVDLITEEVASVGFSAQGGLEIVGTVNISSELADNSDVTSIHDCTECIDGDLNFKFSLDFKADLIFFDECKLTLYEQTVKLGDFYYSSDHREFGFGECPYKLYRVDLLVQSDVYTPAPDVLVTFDYPCNIKAYNGYDDRPWSITSIRTDGTGTASIFVPPGRTKCYLTSGDTAESCTVQVEALKDGYRVNGGEDRTVRHLLGLKTEWEVLTPPAVPAAAQAAVQEHRLSLGWDCSAFVTEDHALYLWGENLVSALGQEWQCQSDVPFRYLEDVAAVQLVEQSGTVLTLDGTMYQFGTYFDTCGDDWIGLGSYEGPHKVLENVVDMDLGSYHYAAVTADGSLYTWGYNKFGQLGDGTTEMKKEPVKVMEHVRSVSLGDYRTGIITEDGSLYVCGDNRMGQLGDGTLESRSRPVKIMDNVASVDFSWSSTAALTTDGVLYGWEPTFKDGKRVGTEPRRILDHIAKFCLQPLINATVLVITDTGDLYRVSYEPATHQAMEEVFTLEGEHIFNGYIYADLLMKDVVDVASSGEHYAALTKDGRLWTWGSNNKGELGNGTQEDNDIPAPIEIPETVQTQSLPHALAAEETPSSFTDLLPDTLYNLYILRTQETYYPLAPGNLLYLSQFVTDDTGSAAVSYAPADGEVLLVPAQRTLYSLSAALEDLPYTGDPVHPAPSVYCEGRLLTEGVDYALSGDVEAAKPGHYLLTITGIGDYMGELTTGYTVYNAIEFTLGDVTEDGTVNANDAARILVAAARIGAKRDSGLTEAQFLAANVNGDAAVNAIDASIVLRYAAAIGAKRQVELTDFI